MKRNAILYVVAMVTFYSLLFTPTAFAYIDPGTGSMILQALLAGLVAVLAFYKQIIARLSVFFAKEAVQTKQQAESNDD